MTQGQHPEVLTVREMTNITSCAWAGRLFDTGKMTVTCDRCAELITGRYGWNHNSMICEACLRAREGAR